MEAQLAKSDIDWLPVKLVTATHEQLFLDATRFAEKYFLTQLNYYRNIRSETVTPDTFWSEYIWCVYTSGFKASIVSKMHPKLMEIYGSYKKGPTESIWDEVKTIIANSRKYEAVEYTRMELARYPWDKFKRIYLGSPEDMRQLPFIGKITCNHLARNLGLDVVKEDLHLVRLAKHYKFETGLDLCQYLARFFGERVGVVDYILWNWCANFGTMVIA